MVLTNVAGEVMFALVVVVCMLLVLVDVMSQIPSDVRPPCMLVIFHFLVEHPGEVSYGL